MALDVQRPLVGADGDVDISVGIFDQLIDQAQFIRFPASQMLFVIHDRLDFFERLAGFAHVDFCLCLVHRIKPIGLLTQLGRIVAAEHKAPCMVPQNQRIRICFGVITGTQNQ